MAVEQESQPSDSGIPQDFALPTLKQTQESTRHFQAARPQGNVDPEKAALLPEPVRATYETFGPDYDYSHNPMTEVAKLLSEIRMKNLNISSFL